MKITDRVAEILTQSAGPLIIGRSPKSNLPFVQVEQWVPTGPDGNSMLCKHQAENESLSACLDQISHQMAHATILKSENLIALPKNGR